MVTSKTKYEASEEEIKELFSFHKVGNVINISPLGNGEFNATYKVSCDNGDTYALKISPPDDSKVLSYEKNMMGSEVFWYKQMKEKTKEDITLPVKIYNSIKDDVVTDLSVDTISYLVSEYADYSFDENDIYTMEGETKLGEDGFAYFYPDDEALKALVIKLFYKEVDR